MCSSIELEVTTASKAFGGWRRCSGLFLFWLGLLLCLIGFFSFSRAVGEADSWRVESLSLSLCPKEAASPCSGSETWEARPKQEMPQALLMESWGLAPPAGRELQGRRRPCLELGALGLEGSGTRQQKTARPSGKDGAPPPSRHACSSLGAPWAAAGQGLNLFPPEPVACSPDTPQGLGRSLKSGLLRLAPRLRLPPASHGRGEELGRHGNPSLP